MSDLYSAKTNWMERIANLYVYVMLGVFPLVLSTKYYVNLTRTKYLFFAIATGVLLAVSLVYGIITLIRKKQFCLFSSMTQWAFGLYFVAAAVSILFSPYRQYALWGAGRYEGIFTLFFYLSAFFIVAHHVRFSWWHIFTLGVSMTVFSAIGIGQIFGASLFYPTGRTFLNSHFLSTIGNIDFVSGMLCIALPLFFAGFVYWDAVWGRLLFIPLALGTFVFFAVNVESGLVGLLVLLPILFPLLVRNLMTFSRFCAAVVAVCLGACFQQLIVVEDGLFMIQFSDIGFLCFGIIGLCLMLQLLTLFFPKEPSTIVFRVVSCMLVIFMLIGAGWAVNQSKEKQRGFVYEFTEVLKGNLDDSFGTNRMFLWKRTLPLIGRRPFFGYGPDAFRWVFQEHYEEDVKALNQELYFDAAHNDYLQIGVNYGLIGLLLYLIAIITLLVRAFYYRHNHPLIPAGLLSAIAYLTQIFFSFSVPIVAPVAWIILGLLENSLLADQQTESTPFSPETYVAELLEHE